jgi:L-seryl-tRNA(Ser) seleniumtransferase
MGIYDEIGAKRVINASFPVTLLGGSRLTKEMIDAFTEANESYVDFWDFMQKAGKYIAGLTGAEAAFPTCGAFSALALSATACIAGKDPVKIRKLPDASGMKNEIIIQKCLRAPIYDRSMTVSGGKFVIVGNETGCTLKEMEAAINEKTAAIHFLASDRMPEKALTAEEIVKIAKKHSVPIIMDAAGQTWPIDGLRKWTRMGVDLVCYSSKYFGGPNAAGFVQGRKDLVEAVSIHTFLGQESQGRIMDAYSVGRGYKMDRQTVCAMLYALKRWVTMDHEKERIQPAVKRAQYILNELKSLSKVKVNLYPEKFTAGHILGVQLNFPNDKMIQEVAAKLREGDPAIWIRGNIVNTLFLKDGEEKIIVKRLKEILA